MVGHGRQTERGDRDKEKVITNKHNDTEHNANSTCDVYMLQQSCIEREYSVVFFNPIAAFEVPHC